MGLVDDLKADVGQAELGRRKLLGLLTGSTLAIAGLGTTITTVSFLRPTVLFEPPTRFKVGDPADIPIGALIVMAAQKTFIVRTEAGFVALSSVCTHLGCVARYEDESKAITCPCHGSNFDTAGKVTAGPAPRPLDRRHLELADGQLIVDVHKKAADDFVLEV